MPVGAEVARIAATLTDQFDPSSRHFGEAVAAGVIRSGLAAAVVDGFRELTDSTYRLGLSTGIQLNQLATQLGAGNRLLASINEAIRNPLATQAAERLRRGQEAFRHGWAPEAIAEFRAATELDPYSAHARLLLALALLRDKEPDLQPTSPDEVEAQLQLAYRYGTPPAPGIAVAAALLLVRQAETRGDLDGAMEWARRASEAHPTCAELHLEVAVLTGQPASLGRALHLAPDLLPVAVARRPSLVDAVALSPEAEPVLDRGEALRVAMLQLTQVGTDIFDSDDLDDLEVPVPALPPADAITLSCALTVAAPTIGNAAWHRESDLVRAVQREASAASSFQQEWQRLENKRERIEEELRAIELGYWDYNGTSPSIELGYGRQPDATTLAELKRIWPFRRSDGERKRIAILENKRRYTEEKARALRKELSDLKRQGRTPPVPDPDLRRTLETVTEAGSIIRSRASEPNRLALLA